MTRRIALTLLLLLTACVGRLDPPSTAIVGATLIDGNGPAVSRSVVIVKDGKIVAVGPQTSTPVPAASRKVDGSGKYLVSAQRGGRLMPGAEADLLLLGSNPLEDPRGYDRVDMRMRKGEWVAR